MTVYFVTGKLSSGKILAAVGRMRDYRVQNRRIAGNTERVIVLVVGFLDRFPGRKQVQHPPRFPPARA